MENQRLLIKVIASGQGKSLPKPSGGSGKFFKEVTEDVRNNLLSQIDILKLTLEKKENRSSVIPIIATLEDKAIAKSHFPTSIINEHTTPAIGVGSLGKLYLRGTLKGLEELKSKIRNIQKSENIDKQISAIVDFKLFELSNKLQGSSLESIFQKSPLLKEKKVVKVNIFDYDHPEINKTNKAYFEGLLKELDLDFKEYIHTTGKSVYSVNYSTLSELSKVSEFVSIKSVTPMPIMHAVRKDNDIKPATIELSMPSPGNEDAFPIVAIVDSGVNTSSTLLSNWVYEHDIYVSKNEENKYHGTFVAGLLVWADELNPHLKELENLPCRILDVQILPDSDKFFIGEHEFLQSLEDSLQKYSKDVRIWNLSVGSNEVCSLDEFSDFAIELDNLQEKYDVIFVIASGNFVEKKILGYPRGATELALGRITSPADSVLGITVGSIAHLDCEDSVKSGEPSPFSRSGPGPNHIIKPDLVHFGGNNNLENHFGIKSIGENNCVIEDIGTSLSTPIVSRQLATIYHSIEPSPSTNLAKAILIHSARDLRTQDRIRKKDSNVLGFGTPVRIGNALDCDPWQITMVFDEVVGSKFEMSWEDFPYPDSLIKNGSFFGEIAMTLVYNPHRNGSFGSEYCETHLEAKFGLVKFNEQKQKEEFRSQVPLEHLQSGDLYENQQVASLRKWAPTRTYYRKISRGVVGLRWDLRVSLLVRHKLNIQKKDIITQPFSLILTISDPNKKMPIYNEMVRKLRTRFAISDIPINNQVRTVNRVRP